MDISGLWSERRLFIRNDNDAGFNNHKFMIRKKA